MDVAAAPRFHPFVGPWLLSAFVLAGAPDAPGSGTDLTSGLGTARAAARVLGRPLAVDPWLARAAEDHAKQAAAGLTSEPEERVRARGLGDPVVRGVTVRGGSRPAAWRAAVPVLEAHRAGDATHVGAGWAAANGKVTLSIVITSRPLEWSRADWSSDRFSVVAATPAEDLRVVWLSGCADLWACDRVQQRDLPRAHVRLASPWSVVVMHGDRVVGRWVRPGLLPSEPPRWTRNLKDPETWWAEVRRRHGLSAQQVDPRLARAAERHAGSVCQDGVARHLTAAGGPQERARRAGFTGTVGENVAVAHTMERAHHNLLASPAHRATWLDPRVKRVGLSAVRTPQRVCVVQVVGYE